MLTISDNRFVPVSAVLSALILCGCSTSSNTVSPSSGAKANTEIKTPSQDNSTAQKKISMAIGQEIAEFTITSQQKIDAPAGYDGTQYSVKTNTGKSYKCEILEMSGFGKAMTWGMGTGASAMCTDFTKGSADAGKTNKASCNALLKAAGRC
jgi:hypothetical protein